MLQSTEFGTTPHQLGSFPKPFCLHSFRAKTCSSSLSLWRLAPGLFSPELIGLPKWQNMTKHDKTNHEKTNCPPIQSDPWWTQKSCPAGPASAVLLLPPLSSDQFSLPLKWKVWSAGNLPWFHMFHSFQVHPPLECQAAGALPCLAETDDSTTVAQWPASSNSLKGKNTHAEQRTWKNLSIWRPRNVIWHAKQPTPAWSQILRWRALHSRLRRWLWCCWCRARFLLWSLAKWMGCRLSLPPKDVEMQMHLLASLPGKGNSPFLLEEVCVFCR